MCEGKLAKVCDFGLARDLTKDQDYVAKGNVSQRHRAHVKAPRAIFLFLKQPHFPGLPAC